MFGSRPLRRSDCERVLLLLGALALSLLVVLGARAGTPRMLLEDLRRDLGALRVQLEQVEAVPMAASGVFDLSTDIGDGSPAFRRQTLSTILRSAHRRLDRLGADSRRAESDARAGHLDRLRLGLLELQVRLDRLLSAGDAAQAAKARAAAFALLEDLDGSVALLLESTSAKLSVGISPRAG